MNTTYLRGQLYYADLSKGVGSEQEGYRPVLIVQNNVGNKYSPTVIVAAVTSKVGVKPKLPTHYFIEANTVGLTAPSIVLLEQLRTLDKRRLERYIGRVDSCHIREINRALAVSVGLMEEMPENLIMCLCPTCANNFYGTGSYFLRRVNTDSSEKDICTYCGQRRGFDYEIVRRGQYLCGRRRVARCRRAVSGLYPPPRGIARPVSGIGRGRKHAGHHQISLLEHDPSKRKGRLCLHKPVGGMLPGRN